MAPDADAGKASPQRADPFAPLTSERLSVGDDHEIYVESIGRQGGIPAVYLHGGPGSGCQPNHRRLFDPERFHAVLFDQRGAGRSRPKGSRDAQHAAPSDRGHGDDPRTHLALNAGWWSAAPGAQRWRWPMRKPHPQRVSGIVLRATFLGTRTELDTRVSQNAAPAFIPHSMMISSVVLATRDERRPAAGRLIGAESSMPIAAVPRTGRARLGWDRAHPVRTQAEPREARSGSAALGPGFAVDAVHGSALFPEQLLHEAGSVDGGS